MTEKIKIFFKRILMVIASLASIILLFIFLRWCGRRGIAAFFAGMTVMAYLILSKNSTLMYMIESTKSGEYIDNLKENQKEKEKEKGNT